jgi:hypothetical protein
MTSSRTDNSIISDTQSQSGLYGQNIMFYSRQSKTLLFKTNYAKPYRLLDFINKISCVHVNMNLKPRDTNQGVSGETLIEVIGRPGERKRRKPAFYISP